MGFTDSGTSCIIVPNKYFIWLLDRLRYDFNLSYSSTNTEDILVDCSVKDILPTIWFLFGGYWI